MRNNKNQKNEDLLYNFFYVALKKTGFVFSDLKLTPIVVNDNQIYAAAATVTRYWDFDYGRTRNQMELSEHASSSTNNLRKFYYGNLSGSIALNNLYGGGSSYIDFSMATKNGALGTQNCTLVQKVIDSQIDGENFNIENAFFGFFQLDRVDLGVAVVQQINVSINFVGYQIDLL